MHEENLSIKINGDDSTGLWKQIKLVRQSFLGLQLIGQIWKKAVAISSGFSFKELDCFLTNQCTVV
ncbi:unnamed protein product [Musa banksii]